jgi:hypothetical protein
MMEQFQLQEITTEPFSMRSLDGNRPEQEFDLLLAKSTTIQSEMEIANELMIFIPISKTFPSINAMLVISDKQIIVYIQVTVSAQHPIKFQQLNRVYRNLNENCQEFKQFDIFFLSLLMYLSF